MTTKDQTVTEPKAYFGYLGCTCLWHVGGVDAKGTLPGSPLGYVRDAIAQLCQYPGHHSEALMETQPDPPFVP